MLRPWIQFDGERQDRSGLGDLFLVASRDVCAQAPQLLFKLFDALLQAIDFSAAVSDECLEDMWMANLMALGKVRTSSFPLSVLHLRPLATQLRHGYPASHLTRYVRHHTHARATWCRFGRDLVGRGLSTSYGDGLGGWAAEKVLNIVRRRQRC